MMIFFVLFAVAIALLLQRAAAEKGLDAVEGDHWPDKRLVEPGETFSVEVLLKNNSRRFIPFLRVRERFDRRFRLGGDAAAAAPDRHGKRQVEFTTWLRPRQQAIRAIPVSLPARGRYLLDAFSLSGGDFLGLEEYEKPCGTLNEVVVMPREAPFVRLREVFGGFLGEVSVNRFILEDPVLTLGYREYTGREPMKMISWAQSARGNGLMVKKNDYTLEPSVTVILNVDTPGPNREELLEKCFSIARTVCGILERRGVKYSFVSNAIFAGRVIELLSAGEGLGHNHYYGILEQLGRATYEPHLSMERLLQNEARRQTASGRVLITPGAPAGPSAQRALGRLREAAGGSLLVINAEEAAQW